MVLQYMFHTPPGGKNWEVHTLGLRLFNEILNKEKYIILTVDWSLQGI